MANINCPLPQPITHEAAREAFKKAKARTKGLQESQYRREAARDMGVDYDTFLAAWKKPTAPGGLKPPTRAPGVRSAVKKPEPVTAPKPTTAVTDTPPLRATNVQGKWSEKIIETEYADELEYEFYWGRTKLGSARQVPHGFNEDTGEAITKWALKTRGSPTVTHFETLDMARQVSMIRYAMDSDITEILERMRFAIGEVHVPRTGPIKLTNNTYKFRDRNLEKQLIGDDHMPGGVRALDRAVQHSGDRVHNEFQGFHRYNGGDEIAHYQPGARTMTVNPKYGKSSDQWMKTVTTNGENSRFHTYAMDNDGLHGNGMGATLSHEFGHHIQYTIDTYTGSRKVPNMWDWQSANGPFDPDALYKQTTEWRAEIKLAGEIKKALYDDIISTIEEWYVAQGYPRTILQKDALEHWYQSSAMNPGSSDMSWIAFIKNFAQVEGKGNSHKSEWSFEDSPGQWRHTRPEWAEMLSKYAGRNGKEFFAEVWCEYSNGGRPRAHVRKMGAAIQEALIKLERLHASGVTP